MMKQKIIEELKKRGFVENLQHAVDAGYKLLGASEKAQLECSKYTLREYVLDEVDEDDELSEMFIEFATDLAAEAIIKELDLKPNKDYEPSSADKLAVLLGKLFKGINKEDK